MSTQRKIMLGAQALADRFIEMYDIVIAGDNN